MERRRKQRSSTRMTVIVTVAGASLPCEMRNLSQSGCLIACDPVLAEVGAPVAISLMRGLAVTGEVAWQMGESVGVFFREPIPLAVVRHYALDDWMLKADWSLSGSGLAP
ncbi:MAG: PilZ domain-containing protein [Myxococcota bacterium]|jgi:hypothetical protein